VSVALLDPLAPPLDRLVRLLLEHPVEQVDIATREAEPLANRADEAVDFAVDIRLGVARVLDRQNEVANASQFRPW
jgi:hypothetical protein